MFRFLVDFIRRYELAIEYWEYDDNIYSYIIGLYGCLLLYKDDNWWLGWFWNIFDEHLIKTLYYTIIKCILWVDIFCSKWFMEECSIVYTVRSYTVEKSTLYVVVSILSKCNNVKGWCSCGLYFFIIKLSLNKQIYLTL